MNEGVGVGGLVAGGIRGLPCCPSLRMSHYVYVGCKCIIEINN